MLFVRSRDFKRRAAAMGAGLILFTILVGMTSRLWQFGTASPFTDPLDFRAFYCAGSAVAGGKNPYRLEPDRTCQRAVLAGAGLRLNEHFVLPAPLPPYALVEFAGLALLPYRLAAPTWMSLNVLALVFSIVLLSQLSGSRPAFVALALFLSAGIVCLSLGQVVPIVLAAGLFTAFSVRKNDGRGAAIGATFAALEPHLALPIWIALGLCIPVARRPLAVAAVVLGTLTLLPGLDLNAEYFRSVLPQHARAEILNLEGQYGLSSVLAAANVPAETALRAGTACYVIMLAFGLTLGSALRNRFKDDALYVVTPVAAVVLGGPFLHIQQTVVAMPLAFMLLSRLPRYSVASRAVFVAVCCLAIPWPLADMAVQSPPSATERKVVPRTPARISDAAPNASIEIPYAAFIARFEQRPNKHSAFELIVRKSPTWLALIALLTVASGLTIGGSAHTSRGKLSSLRPL